jgi:hypothetical protein
MEDIIELLGLNVLQQHASITVLSENITFTHVEGSDYKDCSYSRTLLIAAD